MVTNWTDREEDSCLKCLFATRVDWLTTTSSVSFSDGGVKARAGGGNERKQSKRPCQP